MRYAGLSIRILLSLFSPYSRFNFENVYSEEVVNFTKQFLIGLALIGCIQSCNQNPVVVQNPPGFATMAMAAQGKPPPNPPPGPPLDYSGYSLAWSDEFNDTLLDSLVWNYETGNGNSGWGNNELEYYTGRPENVRLENGELIIEARKEAYNGFNYTSARIKTQGKKSFQYGIIEARIKSPVGNGLWPAFWMLGNDISTVGWPKCGETDIMENKGTNTSYGYAHWFNEGTGSLSSSGSTVSTSISQYHVYSVLWNDQAIKWYVDGVLLHSLDVTPGTLSEFHQDFFIILNLAVGGNFTGAPRRTTTFPAKLNIDWVRVYQ